MSGAAGGDDVETLARALYTADKRGYPDDPTRPEVFEDHGNALMYGMQAEDFLASDWLADRLLAERAEGAREALEDLTEWFDHMAKRAEEADSPHTAVAFEQMAQVVRDDWPLIVAARATQDPT